ncbi:MAG: hypothetical protein L0Y58_07590 [Verrucomicrobia subdivision 3 bacterium]|nr:hypothetical protein [Limisphaerales bacterium]
MKEHGAELLAIHVECSPEGTALAVKRNGLKFPMANDDRLEVVDKYSPTSTYLIDKRGIVRARWFDTIHLRVGSQALLQQLEELAPDEAAK